MSKLSSLVLGLLTIAIAAPITPATTFTDRLVSRHSKNIQDRHQQLADTREFNVEFYSGDPERREETLQRSRGRSEHHNQT